jgi:genome maintenance exonuclease 1
MFNYCTPKLLPDLKSETVDGKRVYTLEDGTHYPSITTVLSILSRDAINAWRQRVGEEEANRVSRKASGRGTNVHTLCERYLNNEKLGDVMPDAKEMFMGLIPYLDKIDNIRYQEQALWSRQLGVAGRVDCIGEYNGKLSVIDFKTSKRVKKRNDIMSYFMQTAAYALMYEELIGEPINNLVIIMAVEDSEPLIFEEKTEDHIDGLVSVIKQYYHENRLTWNKK